MIFDQSRPQMRQFFLEAWRKYQAHAPLQPMETIVAGVVRQHPEYQAALEAHHPALEQDYFPETGQTNPFLHMGLHIAIQEQLAVDRPPGIVAVYQSLLAACNDPHEAEHRILECLGEMLWRAQRNNVAPDEADYMACLHKLAGMN